MDRKVCIACNTENNNDHFYNKNRECKRCNIHRSIKRYFENKDKLSNQRKINYEKNRDVLLAKFKINQQNRKSHAQQITDFNKKIEELTQFTVYENVIFNN